MNTLETATSLEDMLDGAQPAEVADVPQSQPEPTGDNSTVPPTDATAEQSRNDDGPMVPRRALEDERRKRQDLERRFSEMERGSPQRQQQAPQQYQQQQVEIPDPWADPHGYAQFVTEQALSRAHHVAAQQAEEVIMHRELNRSERRARKTHGDETVDAAFEAVKKAGVEVLKRIATAEDSYDEMIAWYNDYQIAVNPAAHRERIEAEILAKHGLTPQSGAQPQSQPSKVKAPVPRSLASTASAQPRNDRGQFQGATPLEDLLP